RVSDGDGSCHLAAPDDLVAEMVAETVHNMVPSGRSGVRTTLREEWGMAQSANAGEEQYTTARQLVIAKDFEVRRSELSCPGHSLKMMARAASSSADQVMFDLEDGCAVSQKEAARATVAQALNTLDLVGKIRTFRPNGITTRYFYRDLIEIVEVAGRNL